MAYHNQLLSVYHDPATKRGETMKTKNRAALYLRVSTDSQQTEHQRRQLEEVAERRGWEIVQVYEDAGVSGAKGRDRRPGLDAMLKDATRGRFDLIAAWSVDRLGRSLRDLLSTLDDVKGVGCDLYLHQQAVDTTTPSGRAMFSMMGVFAEFERSMIRERVLAGLATARAKGRQLGRPRVANKVEQRIAALLYQGMGQLRVAKEVGCGVSTVQRIVRASRLASAAGGGASSLVPA
jgi:DNA invertase Pin-like site-specific DNA recombinase